MLHNSGSYGPNDVQNNMGVPINKPQIGGPVDLVQNLSAIGKLGQNQHQQLLQQFGGPDYTAFDLHNHNLSLQSNNFATHSSAYVTRMSNQLIPPEYTTNASQSGLLPYFNAHSNSNMNYHPGFPSKMYQRELNESNNQDISRDFPLSIPQVPTLLQKHMGTNSDVVRDYTNDSNYCYDKEKVSSKQNKCNKKTNVNVRTKDTTEADIVKREEEISGSGKCNVEKESQIVVTKKVHKRKRKTPEKITVETKPIETKEVNMLKCIKIEVEIEETTEQETQQENEMESVDQKLSLTDIFYTNPFIRDMNAVRKDSILNVLRDMDGHTKDNVMNVDIVPGDTSVDVAKKDGYDLNATKDPLTTRYYECPHCEVLHQNVKRFLVHVKWHSFGLTNRRRIEKEEAKEVKRAIRSGEVIDGASEGDGAAGRFPCKYCPKVFTRNNSLKNHRFQYHKTVPRECRVCGLVLPDWKSLREHDAAAHPPGEELPCAHCNKTFKYKHTLAKHTQTHFEKTWACEQCPRKYGSDQLLKQHMKTHERAERGPTLHCTYCAKGFYETYNLKVHEQTHRNERPFACEICGSAFGTNSTLKRHLRVSHSKSKPHECSTCHRSFTTALIRDRHELRLHGNDDKFQHSCDKCERKFRSEKELVKHTCRGNPEGKRRQRKRPRDPVKV